MTEPSFAIIGRGLAGLTLAFRMVRRGLRPVIYGEAQGPGNASRCAQGIVCNKGLIFAESPLFRAKLRTLKELEPWLRSIEQAGGGAIPRTRAGVDEPYWSPEDFETTMRRVYRGNFWGCYRARNLPPRDWPADFRRPAGYVHYPDDAWFDVDATLNALERACALQGAEFRDGTIEDLRPLLARHDHTVVAAGASSLKLLQTLGLEVPRSFLVAGQSLAWPEAAPEPRILVKGTLSLAVLGERRILGSTSWKAEPGLEPDQAEDCRNLLQQGSAVFGFASPDAGVVESRVGTRIRFADRMPALGVWPEPGQQRRLSILSGFYKNGLQLADLCAGQLLHELRGEPLSEFGEAFHIRRFFSDGRRASGAPPRHCPAGSEHKAGAED